MNKNGKKETKNFVKKKNNFWLSLHEIFGCRSNVKNAGHMYYSRIQISKIDERLLKVSAPYKYQLF